MCLCRGAFTGRVAPAHNKPINIPKPTWVMSTRAWAEDHWTISCHIVSVTGAVLLDSKGMRINPSLLRQDSRMRAKWCVSSDEESWHWQPPTCVNRLTHSAM
jgi:hypothetical protein